MDQETRSALRAWHQRLQRIPRGEASPMTDEEVGLITQDAALGCVTCRAFIHGALRGQAGGRIKELQEQQSLRGIGFLGWEPDETLSMYRARAVGLGQSKAEQARNADRAAHAVIATARRQPGEMADAFRQRVAVYALEAVVPYVFPLPGEDEDAYRERAKTITGHIVAQADSTVRNAADV